MSAVALIGSLGGSGTFTLENGRLARLNPAAFADVIRAVDQGLPIDPIRVGDRMEAALAGGSLAIPRAEGAIAIDAGAATLKSSTDAAHGTELAVSGSVNLTDGAVDARLTLSGPAGAGAPTGTRPEIDLTLKGAVEMPKRTIDVAVLASWLALRAVEQQSKKLDVLENRVTAATAASPAAAAPEGIIPLQGGVPAPGEAQIEPDEQRRPAVRIVPTIPIPMPRPPSVEQAQPLPPPVDIRSAPAPRAPRQQPGAAGVSQQARPVMPPRPRSLSEILFGN